MKTSRVRWIAAVLLAASLFAVGPGTGYDGGCYNLATEGFMWSLKPCAILDCDDGLFGGAIDPCGIPGFAADDLFVGCP